MALLLVASGSGCGLTSTTNSGSNSAMEDSRPSAASQIQRLMNSDEAGADHKRQTLSDRSRSRTRREEEEKKRRDEDAKMREL